MFWEGWVSLGGLGGVGWVVVGGLGQLGMAGWGWGAGG